MEAKSAYTDKVLVDDAKHGVYRMLRSYKDRNSLGERVEIEFSKCTNPHTKHSMPRMWHKNGWTDSELESWWHIDTFVYRDDAWETCYGGYNPTIKRAQGRKGPQIDFDWVLEATLENLAKLTREIERRAFGKAGDKHA